MSRSACTVRYQGVSEPVDRDGLNGIESLPVPRGIGRAGRPSFPYWFVVLRHSSEAVPGGRAKAKGVSSGTPRVSLPGRRVGHVEPSPQPIRYRAAPRVMAGFMRCCPSQFIGYGLHDPDG